MLTRMRARIGGAVLLVLLSAGLLNRITDHAGTLPSSQSAPVEIRVEGKLLDAETVDPKTGDLHLQIPIQATRKR